MIRLHALGVQADQLALQKLAEYCSGLQFPILTDPWRFAVGSSIAVPAGRDAQLLEKQLMSWALSSDKSTDWLMLSLPLEIEPTLVGAAFEWRQVQVEMLRKLKATRDDSVAILEGGTGTGKTRVTCQDIVDRLGRGEGPVLLAVPTVILARQWLAELAEIDPNLAVQPVLGVSHYLNPKEQLLALREAAHAPLVICTQHMLLQLLPLQSWRLVIDEAHLLYFAIAATSGRFIPVQAMGAKFEAWCRDSLGLQEGLAQEVMLKGRMRQAVIAKAGLTGDSAQRANVYVVVQAEGGIGVALREPGSAERSLLEIWGQCRSALLLSATQSSKSGAGVRSTRLMAERLCIPAQRLQDLGQIKAPWRDANVVVRVPLKAVGKDGEVWLSPHARRIEVWWEEVAMVIAQWRSTPSKKTLVLATSYDDVAAIAQACKRLGVTGVVASERHVSMHELHLAIETAQVWCWVATGAAWTGMDLRVPLSRLVIAKLPLQNPNDAEELQHPDQVRFDSVNRFKQGIGRMVRSEAAAEARELVLLDGRINERSSWWRGVVQPYMQVLGEDFEDHQPFGMLM